MIQIFVLEALFAINLLFAITENSTLNAFAAGFAFAALIVMIARHVEKEDDHD